MTLEASESTEGEGNKKMQCIISCLGNIIESICPLMDDLKTKIKIKTLDLMIFLSIKTKKIDQIK